MMLRRFLTGMLVRIHPKHTRYVEDRGTYGVVLDKAFYSCVEAATTWHANLCAEMESNDFVPNPYVFYVFNKYRLDGAQVTKVTHVDDLFIAIKSVDNQTNSESYLCNKYKEIKASKGKSFE